MADLSKLPDAEGGSQVRVVPTREAVEQAMANASSNSIGLLGYATAADVALRLIRKAVADARKNGSRMGRTDAEA